MTWFNKTKPSVDDKNNNTIIHNRTCRKFSDDDNLKKSDKERLIDDYSFLAVSSFVLTSRGDEKSLVRGDKSL